MERRSPAELAVFAACTAAIGLFGAAIGSVGTAVGAALALGMGLLLAVPAVGDAAAHALIGEDGPDAPEPAWVAGGLLFLVAVIGGLEWMQPHYFTQNDNYAVVLPNFWWMAANTEAGIVPYWNPYQFLGGPLITFGTSTWTYPPTFLAWLVAHHLLGRDEWMIEILAVGHLVVGYVVTVAMLRELGARGTIASAGALSFVLCGYILLAGRCWSFHVPLVVWLPAAIAVILRLRRAVGPGYAAAGIGYGFAFYAICAQLWVYLGLMAGAVLAQLVLTGAVTVRRAAWLVPTALIGLSIALPLAVLQLRQWEGIRRNWYFEGDIVAGLATLFLPWPLASAPHPFGWGSVQVETIGQMYYSGTVFAVVGFATALAAPVLPAVLALDRATLTRIAARNPAIGALWLVFLLSLGFRGPVWPILSVLPVFSGMNSPYKFLPYVVLLAVAVAAPALQRLASPLAARAVWISVAGLLAWHASLCRDSWYNFADGLPYPPLPQALAEVVQGDPARPTARVWTFGPENSVTPGFVSSLRDQWATVYGVATVDGYRDQMVSAAPIVLAAADRRHADPVGAARAYGVRWVWVHRVAITPVPGPNPGTHHWERLSPADAADLAVLRSAGRVRLDLPEGVLLELAPPDPMAFRVDAPIAPLPMRWDGGGIDVDVEGPAVVVVNALAWPWFRAWADGVEVEVEPDEWLRLRATVPAGAHHLAIRYSPPWTAGLLAAAAALIAGLASLVGVYRYDRGDL